ncbi:unnamed protein product [Tenebrio molitor]|nr:unnamed protein product [Tenebrio molitor]
MGKNHRHAKKLKSEKNKVHITSKTKFLPKGQNVTNTAFKIKPIVLHEQLKEREASTSSNKKVNVDELISKLRHFNETIKSEACQDLKDFIAVHPIESTHIYLSSILQTSSALIQDRERKVRRAATKLLATILEKATDVQVRPFFNYILINLKCAMTNINKHIQEDSLHLLDAVLDHKAPLIADNFDNFFPNFLTLISKSKTHSSERSLTLNLEGKVSSVKWRVRVLTRLYGILNAMVQSRHTKHPNLNCDSVVPISLNAKGTVFVPIYKNSKIYENESVQFNSSYVTNNCPDFGGQISNLAQLLHEIWMEVVPEKAQKKNVSEQTTLGSEESVAVFICTVNILRLLHQYIQFSGSVQDGHDHLSTFLDHLLSNFPYSHNKKLFQISKDFPKSFSFNFYPNCVEENLTIIHVFVTLGNHSDCKNGAGNKAKSIGPYLKNCLKAQSRLSSSNASCLVKIVKELLLKRPNTCQKMGTSDVELMESVASFYSNGKVPEGCRSDILEILTSSRFEKHQSWVEKLPDFLCAGQVPAKLVEACLELVRKGHEGLQEGLKNHVELILDNLPSLEITETDSLESVRKSLVNIFFYLPGLSSDMLCQIDTFIETHPDLSYSHYFKNVLELRTLFAK